ncbi:SCO4402 family protein [Micromonospora sp. DT31]|uniref:SCO4402 family protein n=1 Tax=Micromonospora sp. DT31 TaxID=3393434 RepID=UPI003CF111D4
MTTIAWPDRRADVVAALSVLAALRPHARTSWPGLTEAVHWLVDDTFWDQRSPVADIGTILGDADEADAITATLEPLSAVLDELGPTAADDDYLTHPRWREVAHAAADARHLLTAGTPEHRPGRPGHRAGGGDPDSTLDLGK